METRREFMNRVNGHLNMMDPTKLLYNENEYWLIQSTYEYLECYAVDHRLQNMFLALPLVRGLHNGVYRKFGVEKGGEMHRLPYVIHCLLVCRMLVDIHPALSSEDQDCLLAAALCHDLIEDIAFEHGGKELITEFHLNPRVYEIVKLVSKRPDFTIEEERQFFDKIQKNPLALLLKLADRGNNVEDLYNMSKKKLDEYLEETERYFLPMSDYGIDNYPELSIAIHILRDKITILTTVSKVMINKLEARNQILRNQRNQLKLENMKLREEWKRLWEEEMNDAEN
ncbi:MAG: HD domain-containing protein [Eubacterium sp.]|nr:HD domain-containing protein [Eubacterium sp.]